MANYTVADIQALRERTGAGMLDVKKALDEAEGDLDKAVDVLRVRGLKGVSKREGRSASEGLVITHIAAGGAGQVGTLIELNSETDFVAKNDKFVKLAETVLKAVVDAGAADIDAALAAPVEGKTVKDFMVENERRVAEETSRNEGKPEAAMPKIIEGRMNGFFKENVLPEQAFAKDPKTTVGKVVAATGGEVVAFARFRVGA